MSITMKDIEENSDELAGLNAASASAHDDDADKALLTDHLRNQILHSLNQNADLDTESLERLQAARRLAVAANRASSESPASTLSSAIRGKSFFSSLPVWGTAAMFVIASLLVLQIDNRDSSRDAEELLSAEIDLQESVLLDSAEVLADAVETEQLAMLSEEDLDIEFLESLAFYEWLETQEV